MATSDRDCNNGRGIDWFCVMKLRDRIKPLPVGGRRLLLKLAIGDMETAANILADVVVALSAAAPSHDAPHKNTVTDQLMQMHRTLRTYCRAGQNALTPITTHDETCTRTKNHSVKTVSGLAHGDAQNRGRSERRGAGGRRTATHAH